MCVQRRSLDRCKRIKLVGFKLILIEYVCVHAHGKCTLCTDHRIAAVAAVVVIIGAGCGVACKSCVFFLSLFAKVRFYAVP